MFRSKKQVDIHVKHILSKLDDREKKKRFLDIAKQYILINEFPAAKSYLEMYLKSESPDYVAEAQRLFGDVLVQVSHEDEAIDAYMKSYQLEASALVVNKVCDLFSRGYGSKFKEEDKNLWFKMQDSTRNITPDVNGTNSTGMNLVKNSLEESSVGPPRTGFGTSPITTRSKVISKRALQGGSNPLNVIRSSFPGQKPSSGLSTGHRIVGNGSFIGYESVGDSPYSNGDTEHMNNTLYQHSRFHPSPDKSSYKQATEVDFEESVRQLHEAFQQVKESMNAELRTLTSYIRDLTIKIEIQNTEIKEMRSGSNVDDLKRLISDMKTQQKEDNTTLIQTLKALQLEIVSNTITDGAQEINVSSQLQAGNVMFPQYAFHRPQESYWSCTACQTSNLEPAHFCCICKHPRQVSPKNKENSAPVNYEATTPTCVPPQFYSQFYGLATEKKEEIDVPVDDLARLSTGPPASASQTCSSFNQLMRSTPTPFQPTVFAPEFSLRNPNLSQLNVVSTQHQPNVDFIPSNDLFPLNADVASGKTQESSSSASSLNFCSSTSKTVPKATTGSPNVSRLENIPKTVTLSKSPFHSLDVNHGDENAKTSNLSLNQSGSFVSSFSNPTATTTHSNRSRIGKENDKNEVAIKAEFGTVIPIPEPNASNAGNEKVLFSHSHKAVLSVYDEKLKKWKEKGKGVLKILQEETDSQKFRVILKQDKLTTLACDHFLNKEMKINVFENDVHSLSWSAVDNLSGHSRPEVFCCTFTEKHDASSFKTTMEKLISQLKNPKDEIGDAKLIQKPLSELFKPPEGVWACSTCDLWNMPKDLKCVRCCAKEGSSNVPCSNLAPLNKTPPTIFGFDASSSFSFKAPQVTTQSSIGMSNTSEKLNVGSSSFSFPKNDAKDVIPKPDDSKDNQNIKTNLFSPLIKTDTKTCPSFGDFTKNQENSFLQGTFSFHCDSTPAVTKQMFTSKDSSVNAVTSTDKENQAEDFVPTATFKPVIELPPLVDVETGEENENVLFCHRAKLYRYFTATNEKSWKERGTGDIKILQDRDDKHKIRVVMRRDQVLKMACNHRLSKDTKIKYFQNDNRALTWSAMDFSDGQSQPEIFCCRFKEENTAQQFKGKFEEAVKLMENVDEPKATSVVSENKTGGSKESKPSEMKPLSELFKKPEGAWDCSMCLVRNNKEHDACVSCGTSKDGEAKGSSGVVTSLVTTAPTFKFGFDTNSTSKGFQLGPTNSKPIASEPVSCSFKNSESLKKAELWNGKAPTGDKELPALTTPIFGFGGNSSDSQKCLSFSDLAKSTSHNFGFKKDFQFEGTNTPLFADQTSNLKSEGRDDNEHEEFIPSAEFAPVIPLPPVVDVKTGEENEDILFRHRAKLFRYVSETKEWKERGLGDIKILQNKTDVYKVRIILRRDQVFKLACNHLITSDMKIGFFAQRKDSVTWTAMDYVEDPTPEIFCCKFKEEAVCQEFKEIFEKMATFVGNRKSATASNHKCDDENGQLKSIAESILKSNIDVKEVTPEIFHLKRDSGAQVKVWEEGFADRVQKTSNLGEEFVPEEDND